MDDTLPPLQSRRTRQACHQGAAEGAGQPHGQHRPGQQARRAPDAAPDRAVEISRGQLHEIARNGRNHNLQRIQEDERQRPQPPELGDQRLQGSLVADHGPQVTSEPQVGPKNDAPHGKQSERHSHEDEIVASPWSVFICPCRLFRFYASHLPVQIHTAIILCG